jgi:uncharacterized RDD family membrane protein YckC
MESRRRRPTVIDISRAQPDLDFEDDGYPQEFTLPEYQRALLVPRAYALLADLAIVFGLWVIFLGATLLEVSGFFAWDRLTLAVYATAYLLLVCVYFLLSMLNMSQTAGMQLYGLIVVTKAGRTLLPHEALARGLGYVVSVLPLLFGFLWAFIDPEHLTWTDKVSGTFVKRI